jgi:hypothetical protein
MLSVWGDRRGVWGMHDFIWPETFGGRGQGRYSWTNGSPWWPKGVGAGGGCAPSHAKRKKLKYKLILVFPKSYLSNISSSSKEDAYDPFYKFVVVYPDITNEILLGTHVYLFYNNYYIGRIFSLLGAYRL